MIEPSTRFAIDFEPEIREALLSKAALSHQSISDIVNEAIRQSLQEDLEDLAAFDERAAEPTMTYEELLDDLKAHGKL